MHEKVFKMRYTSMTLPPELHDELVAFAKEHNMSQSEVMRHALLATFAICPVCGAKKRSDAKSGVKSGEKERRNEQAAA